MLIQADRLTDTVATIFRRMGSPPEEAALVAASLVKANLMGHDSHGVGLVATYIRHFEEDLLKPGTAVELAKDDGAILMFDGRRGFGRRVGGEAMEAAAERCRDTGVVLMTLRNAHHIGRVGAYGEIAMAHDLVSLHFVNVTDHAPSVAPWGGGEARFVTNPMSKGEQLGEGLLIDADGRPTTDPGVMYQDPRGALLPFGAHKGSGLALMCELLGGGLSGGGTIQPGNPRRHSIVNNMFAILVDPARLVDMDWLRAEIDETVAYVKSARPADPESQVVVAGDSERARTAERQADGIDINDEAWEEMMTAAERLG